VNFIRLLKTICDDEGERLAPYRDSVGIWTIGIGTTRILGVPVHEYTRPITHETAMDLAMSDIYKACIQAQTVIPNLDELSDSRQEVLVNMAYNLGGEGLRKFGKMCAAIQVGDFVQAAAEMKNSRWYVQVGARARRLTERMLVG